MDRNKLHEELTYVGINVRFVLREEKSPENSHLSSLTLLVYFSLSSECRSHSFSIAHHSVLPQSHLPSASADRVGKTDRHVSKNGSEVSFSGQKRSKRGWFLQDVLFYMTMLMSSGAIGKFNTL